MVPKWEGAFERWAKGFVSRNHWKVKHIFPDTEDALQECALIFARCLARHDRHGKPIDNLAWFMGYYKTAVHNNWIVFAQKNTAQRWMLTPMSNYEPAFIEAQEQAIEPDGPLFVALAKSSSELRIVLELIARAPMEVLDILLAPGEPSKINTRWRRWCRIRPQVDLVGELQAILT